MKKTNQYTSPYLVATPKGYTKHYYAESERIASKVGGGGIFNVQCTMYNVQCTRKGYFNTESSHRVLECLETAAEMGSNSLELLKQ